MIGAYHDCVAETVAASTASSPSTWATACWSISAIPRPTKTMPSALCGPGLALVERCRRSSRHPAEALQVRVGIATGLVVVGDLIGRARRRSTAVVGETPNLAARLQALAEPNAVVIAAATRRLIGGLFEYRDLGAVELKGFAEPVRPGGCCGESAVESRFEALHLGRR